MSAGTRNSVVTVAAAAALWLSLSPARAAQEVKAPVDPLEAQESRLDAAVRDLGPDATPPDLVGS